MPSPHPHIVVSVVVPLHQAGEFIGPFMAELSALCRQHYQYYEIILVDDASTDHTPVVVDEILREQRCVRYLALTRQTGREIAMAAGLDVAIGDFVVLLDPATDPVELIPGLIERCRNGAGILCGVSPQARHTGWLAGFASRAFHAYCRRYLGFDYREDATDFRVLDRQAVNAITRIKDRQRFLRVFVATSGLKAEFFTYSFAQRQGAAAKEGLLRHFNRALEIAIAHSRHPLRVVGRLGLVMSFLNFLYGFYIVGIYLFKHHIAEGWTTTSAQNTTMFFFLFLILAVLCEYVGRILEETQDRPLYFVAQELTSSERLEDSIEGNIAGHSAATPQS